MATKELLAKLKDMVECPVCLEEFKDPRFLPCHHSFCTGCLQGLLGRGKIIRCPCCNKNIPVPNGVRSVPVDFRANNLLEAMKQAAALVEREMLDAEAAAPAQSYETDRDAGICPLCNQPQTCFENLPCGHTLCRGCVQFLLPVGGIAFHCPTCFRKFRMRTNSNIARTVSQPEYAPIVSRLTFHPRCGQDIVVHGNQRTVHRQNPSILNDAIVLTFQQLEPDEVFEVRIAERMDKWAGSMKIGVTTCSPTESEFPQNFSQLGEGAWFMWRSTVWHTEDHEWTAIKQNEQDLDDLMERDCVGVERRKNGDLHFYINCVDLGVAAHDIPQKVHGVIGLYGEAGQVTIIATSALASQPALPIAAKTTTLQNAVLSTSTQSVLQATATKTRQTVSQSKTSTTKKANCQAPLPQGHCGSSSSVTGTMQSVEPTAAPEVRPAHRKTLMDRLKKKLTPKKR